MAALIWQVGHFFRLPNILANNAYPFSKSPNKNISNKVTKLIKISKIQDGCLNLTGRPFFHFQFSNISLKTIKKSLQKNFQKKVKKNVHGFWKNMALVFLLYTSHVLHKFIQSQRSTYRRRTCFSLALQDKQTNRH